MSRRRLADEKAIRRTQDVARRAVRRLRVLEWVLLGGAMVAALLAGAVTATVLSGPLGMSWRSIWIGASLVMFVVPGAVVLRKARMDERSARPMSLNEIQESDG